MKKTIYFLIPVLFYDPSGFSQTSCHSVIGIRFGTGYSDLFSVSYKEFLAAVPGLEGFAGGGLTLTNSFSNHDGYSGFGLGLFRLLTITALTFTFLILGIQPVSRIMKRKA
jgi:hypothetical protein